MADPSHSERPSPDVPVFRALLLGRTRYTRWLLFLLIPLLAVAAPPDGRREWVHEASEVFGVISLVICLLGRVWSSVYVAGRKSHELVMLGPYSITRNPLYVFSFIGVIGIACLSEMATLLLVAPVAFALYYIVVVRREEGHLAHLHGAAYANYVRRVPRWWPRFSAWRDIAVLEVSPRLIARHLRDTSLFFLGYLLFEGTEYLRELGFLIPLFRVP
ncbi:MAG: isoprenylcysteine carboxylmethyltransferase family protein [Alphaproteobacteria bacterium]|nr:isoprenylcysteine carboxylmethyltransferase family protein [Alphaproteobacteria bacterium]